jgi:CTP synthase
VPLLFKEEGLDRIIIRLLGLKCNKGDLKRWRKNVVDRALHPSRTTKIAVVGKYIELQDAYKSIYEALRHGGIYNDSKVEILKVDAEDIEANGPERYLKDSDGILVPGGFGSRGIEGKISAIRYAREEKKPFFGICLGMQCATIEFARNVCHLKDANSTEFDKSTPYPVIDLLESQQCVENMGGTMRLGAYPCLIKEGSITYKAYRHKKILERHRHRYEFNNKFRDLMQRKGMVISGIFPKGGLVEIIELAHHPWFIGSQFHPEFKSRPEAPHPLFKDFIKSTLR